MNYVLKGIGYDELEAVTEFSWRLYKNIETSSYPRYMREYKQMYDRLKLHIDHEDDGVVVCYEGENIIGVMGYFVELKEKYIQTVAYFVEKDYANVTDMFIDYIKNKFEGFELLMGFPRENKMAIEYFENRNYECIESSYRYEQNPKLLNYVATDSSIMTVYENLKEEYFAFHKKYEGNMYWTADRLREHFDKWLICVYRPNNEIKASVVMQKRESEELEIFAFFNENVEDDNKLKQLLAYTIKESLSHKTKLIVYFIEDDREFEKRAALSIGFKEIESYKCFKVS